MDVAVPPLPRFVSPAQGLVAVETVGRRSARAVGRARCGVGAEAAVAARVSARDTGAG